MKVLHVSYSDLRGGAAKAAYRLHCAQRRQGIDSQMLVVRKISNDPNVIAVSDLHRVRISIAAKLSEFLLKQQKSNNKTLHSANYFPSGLLRLINRINPDVVNLHWLGGETLSISEIAKIKKPIVWTLHDMWAFSGTEHYDDLSFPDRYKNIYSKNSRNPLDQKLDLSRFIWGRKKKSWRRQKFQIVAPSQWMADCCADSVLLGEQDIRVISNTIDQEIYKPLPQAATRKLFNLPPEKKIILFGAVSSTDDPRKGYSYLVDALKKFSLVGKSDDMHLVIFGASEGDAEKDTGIKTTYMGNLSDEYSLAALYSAADLFVAPSLQDNLPNTIVEALSCGTPCVCFKIGGMPDLIRPGTNGDLAEPESAECLSDSIKQALESESQTEKISLAEQHLRNNDVVSKSYLAIYDTAKKKGGVK